MPTTITPRRVTGYSTAVNCAKKTCAITKFNLSASITVLTRLGYKIKIKDGNNIISRVNAYVFGKARCTRVIHNKMLLK